MPKRPVLALTAGVFLVLGLQGSASQPSAAGFLSAFTWSMTDDRFGGFSGIELAEDGTSFLALTDRGNWTKGRITRTADGIISAVTARPLRPLRGRFEAPLDPNRNDSEGLAVGPDGTVYVSFESAARVLRYDTIDGPARNLVTPREFGRMQNNSALEALAIDRDGTLYTLPERSGELDRPFPVWRYRDGAWDQPFGLRRDGGYLAAGADIGPDGRFYLLERQFHGILGFSTRVRSFALSETGLSGERTELQSGIGQHDNLEGLSVWQDASGAIRLTMIADDNFNFFQKTEIVEYRIPPSTQEPDLSEPQGN